MRSGVSIPVASPSSAAVALGISLVITAVLLLVLVVPVAFSRVRVYSDRVVISAPPLTSFVFSRGDVSSCFITDLSIDEGIRPVSRTWGIALFGLRIGWFKLSNGHRGYLAISTGSREAVVFILRDGTYVVLAPRDIGSLVDALRDMGWLRS